MTIHRYHHHGRSVAVNDRYQGQHKDICICHQCRHRYCQAATLTHDLSETVGRVVVMACKDFEHEETQ